MRLRPIALLLLLPALASAEPLLRIAVVEGKPAARISGEGLRIRALDGEGGYERKEGALRFELAQGSIHLDGRASKEWKIRADGPITVEGITIRGTVEVRIHGGGLLVVNEVPVEAYLAAVLGSEMMPSFHPEALKAQAVASRTYSMRKRLETMDRPYDLGATVLSQVYGGVHREDPRTHEAVQATKGEVLVFEHEPAEAYFFSSCGGKTAEGGEALSRPLPYLRSVSCPEHPDTRNAKWTLDLGAEALAERLGIRGLSSLRIGARSATGRADSVILESPAGTRRMSGAEFRRRIGYGELRSLAFETERKGNRFVFRGRGSGHGAGMCQWGAQAAGLEGWDYRKILSHYYPGIEIRSMY